METLFTKRESYPIEKQRLLCPRATFRLGAALRFVFMLTIVILVFSSCRRPYAHPITNTSSLLETRLIKIVNETSGTIGIAFVSANDTICINNGVRFPMMSVFKLHEALAVVNTLERKGNSLDTVLNIKAREIDNNTWSPMLKEFDTPDFNITVRQLIEYALTQSDNNASNILFSRIVSPARTNEYVRSIAPDTTFYIIWSETDMKENHDLAYDNYTSPLAAALLIKKLFNTTFLGENNQKALCRALAQTTTGSDRLGAVLAEEDEVFFAHKTGSGYRNSRNELIAHNDVGYFRFPDGREYALAVFIKDFRGTEEEASKIIAEVSRQVYLTIFARDSEPDKVKAVRTSLADRLPRNFPHWSGFLFRDALYRGLDNKDKVTTSSQRIDNTTYCYMI